MVGSKLLYNFFVNIAAVIVVAYYVAKFEHNFAVFMEKRADVAVVHVAVKTQEKSAAFFTILKCLLHLLHLLHLLIILVYLLG